MNEPIGLDCPCKRGKKISLGYHEEGKSVKIVCFICFWELMEKDKVLNESKTQIQKDSCST